MSYWDWEDDFRVSCQVSDVAIQGDSFLCSTSFADSQGHAQNSIGTKFSCLMKRNAKKVTIFILVGLRERCQTIGLENQWFKLFYHLIGKTHWVNEIQAGCWNSRAGVQHPHVKVWSQWWASHEKMLPEHVFHCIDSDKSWQYHFVYTCSTRKKK